jgi:hypothetical protein
LHFNIFINDLCDVINHFVFFFFCFTDDLKADRYIAVDVDCVRNCCSASYMKLSVGKSRVMSFTGNETLQSFVYCEVILLTLYGLAIYRQSVLLAVKPREAHDRGVFN